MDELLRQGYSTRGVVRNPSRIFDTYPHLDIRVGEVIQAGTLKGICYTEGYLRRYRCGD